MLPSKWLMDKYLDNYRLPFHDNHFGQSILPYDNTGKITYADHETGQYKRGEQPVLTLLLDQYIGLKQIILHQFNFGHGFASKVR